MNPNGHFLIGYLRDLSAYYGDIYWEYREVGQTSWTYLDLNGISSVPVAGTCSSPVDTDGDGIPNHHDLDSDGDGCPDLVEAGAGPIGNSLVSGPVGFNGLADNLETDDSDTAVINYTSAYELYAMDSTSTVACEDFDGDLIADIFDVDDDNDGILDTDECGNNLVTMTLDPTSSTNNSVVYTGSYDGRTDTIWVTVPASHPGLVGPGGTELNNQVTISAAGAVALWDTGGEGVLLFNSTIPIDQLQFTNLSGFDNFPNGSAKDAIAFDQSGTWSTTNGADLAAYNVNTDDLVTNNPTGTAPANMSAFAASGFEFADKGAKSPLLMRPTENNTPTDLSLIHI